MQPEMIEPRPDYSNIKYVPQAAQLSEFALNSKRPERTGS